MNRKAIEQEIYNQLEKDWDGYSKEDAARIAAKVADQGMFFSLKRGYESAKSQNAIYIERAIKETFRHCGKDIDHEFIKHFFQRVGVERPERDTTQDN